MSARRLQRGGHVQATADVAAQFGFPFSMRVEVALLSFGFSGFVVALFGFFPTRKASLVDPIEALRQE